MGNSGLILGVSGLRGIVGESLTPEVAVRYGAVVGTWLQEQVGGQRRAQVLLATDGRFGGCAIAHAAASGLQSVGCSVRWLGVTMTPSVGVSLDAVEYDGALIITASHNPQAWNGIKVLIRDQSWGRGTVSLARGAPEAGLVTACAPSAHLAEQLVTRFRDAHLQYVSSSEAGQYFEDDDADDKHCIAVKHAIGQVLGKDWHSRMKDADGFRVVTDSVNASSGVPDFLFFQNGYVDLIQLNSTGSGVFPHTPEPTRENLSGEGGLCDVVPGVKADVGFAQDPDADRLAVVDELGGYIGEEYTLVLCAMCLLESRMNQATHSGVPAIVVNLSTSRMIDDVAKHYGAEVVRTAVGEANVVEAMKRLKAEGRDVVLGGEGNGGVIWAEVTYVRDSLSGMALVLSLMAMTGKTVSQLVKMIESMGPGGNGYCIVKEKAALASKSDAVPVVEHLAGVYGAMEGCRVDLQDGIRVDWDAKGVWAHVRASNTEPIMRVIVEAPTEAIARETVAAVNSEIGKVRA